MTNSKEDKTFSSKQRTVRACLYIVTVEPVLSTPIPYYLICGADLLIDYALIHEKGSEAEAYQVWKALLVL
jgi:hypothetical protein